MDILAATGVSQNHIHSAPCISISSIPLMGESLAPTAQDAVNQTYCLPHPEMTPWLPQSSNGQEGCPQFLTESRLGHEQHLLLLQMCKTGRLAP